MNKIKIIALFGKSAGGKDFITNWVDKNYPEINKILMTTTRPKRDREIDNVTYHFINHENFTKKVLDGSIIEATSFNNWFYGTEYNNLAKDKVNIGVFNIRGIECLLEDSRFNILPVYIKCMDKVRLERSLKREQYPDCHEICRRFLEDEKDFDFIPFDYLAYDNSDGFCEYADCCGLMDMKVIKEFLKED